MTSRTLTCAEIEEPPSGRLSPNGLRCIKNEVARPMLVPEGMNRVVKETRPVVTGELADNHQLSQSKIS